MGVTVNANNMSLVHSGSSGTAASFPDACKTPTPAGPVPIPYPNIAQSSDTDSGASTVKADGNPIMLKGSNYKKSSGDEAGSAMGVVSSKNKGKAEPVVSSMDVKADGDGAYRLADAMKTNEGGSANTAAPVTAQGPVLGMPPETQPCKETADQRDEQNKSGPDPAWEKSGIHSTHRATIKQAATDEKCVIYFRATKPECSGGGGAVSDWIGAKHQPKPHACIAGTTITGGSQPLVDVWIEAEKKKGTLDPVYNLPKYIGIIGEARSTKREKIKEMVYKRKVKDKPWEKEERERWVDVPASIQPLRATADPVFEGHGGPYTGMWMTGDYDLFQVTKAGGGCQIVLQGAADFGKLQKAINSPLGWDAIQHGPQAQWIPDSHDNEAGVTKFNMPYRSKRILKGTMPLDADVMFHPARKRMKVIDAPITVVAGDGVVTLDDQQKVAQALRCQECGKK